MFLILFFMTMEGKQTHLIKEIVYQKILQKALTVQLMKKFL